jgi:hypothetical protein
LAPSASNHSHILEILALQGKLTGSGKNPMDVRQLARQIQNESDTFFLHKTANKQATGLLRRKCQISTNRMPRCQVAETVHELVYSVSNEFTPLTGQNAFPVIHHALADKYASTCTPKHCSRKE